MIKCNTFELLKTLSKGEMKEFSEFLRSPFHNTNKSVIRLFEILKKYHPSFNGKNLEKESLFKQVYPDKPYNEQTLKSVIFNTGKLAEEYLTNKSYRNKKAQVKYDLITELMNREKFELAEKYMKDYSNIVSSSKGINDEMMQNKMDYEILNTQFNYRRNKQQEPLGSIYKQADYHIRFSLMRLANFIHDMKVNKIIYNAAYDTTFVEEYIRSLNLHLISEYLSERASENELNEITEIYILRILFYADPKNEKYYYRLKELTLKNLNKFDHHEKYNMFQTLEALCWILQQEVNREKFDLEAYDVYKLRLTHGIYSPDNKYMRIILYRAIIVTVLSFKDYSYAQSFIDNYIEKLPPEHRENMFSLSYALLHFSKGEFEKALVFAGKINFELFAFRYDIRLLIFKVYYELNYFEEAFSLIDAHRHFIKTNKTVSEYYREMHTNFLNFYGRILKIKSADGKIKASTIEKEISSTNNVLAKQWLIDMAEKLAS